MLGLRLSNTAKLSSSRYARDMEFPMLRDCPLFDGENQIQLKQLSYLGLQYLLELEKDERTKLRRHLF